MWRKGCGEVGGEVELGQGEDDGGEGEKKGEG